MLSSVPFGAHSQDTAEYMLGDVVVTVVLFESNGGKDPNLENWNELVRDDNGEVFLDEFGRTISADGGTNLIENVKDRVREGLTWWQDTLDNYGAWLDTPTPSPVHSLNFIYDFTWAHNPIDTPYEPIARISNDYTLWAEDFLDETGYATFESLDFDIRAFNDVQRTNYDADWAYTMFVVNDANDANGKFKSGGSFQRAFAFAGGRFFVTPAGRPASTFAHETGHMFWARDEYPFSGGSYTDRRGYYNTENFNASDNPEDGFEQQPSIMDSGDDFDTAWDANISSESSLAMIGWQDSDGDGVFDVLDVPLTLTGTGYYDAARGNYRFVGHSAVQTLPNLNPSGLRNDITINKVTLAEYSLDDGDSWIVADQYGTYQADLDLTIPVDPEQEILIRTRSVDPLTDLTVTTSQYVFQGNTSVPTSVIESGIQGFAWHDENADGVWNPDEKGLPNWTMQLIDDQGQPLALDQVLEPDDYTERQPVNDVLDGVTLSANGFGTKDHLVGAVSAATASTGQRVLGFVKAGTFQTWGTDWTTTSRRLRIDFDSPTTFLSIDAVANTRTGYGRLEIFDANDNLLDRYTTGELVPGSVETMALSRSTPDIAYAVARSTMDTSIRLDNLQVGPSSSATTDTMGAYAIGNLPPGSYRVQAAPPANWVVTMPASARRDVVVTADGTMQWPPGSERPSDFAGRLVSDAFPWQNPRNPLDVDDSNFVVPRDALIVINELNRSGSRALPAADGDASPPPFLDVNGDNKLSPIDALLVINYLNDQSVMGSGPETNSRSGGGGSAEGEGITARGFSDPFPNGRELVVDALENEPYLELAWWLPDNLFQSASSATRTIRFKPPIREHSPDQPLDSAVSLARRTALETTVLSNWTDLAAADVVAPVPRHIARLNERFDQQPTMPAREKAARRAERQLGPSDRWRLDCVLDTIADDVARASAKALHGQETASTPTEFAPPGKDASASRV